MFTNVPNHDFPFRFIRENMDSPTVGDPLEVPLKRSMTAIGPYKASSVTEGVNCRQTLSTRTSYFMKMEAVSEKTALVDRFGNTAFWQEAKDICLPIIFESPLRLAFVRDQRKCNFICFGAVEKNIPTSPKPRKFSVENKPAARICL